MPLSTTRENGAWMLPGADRPRCRMKAPGDRAARPVIDQGAHSQLSGPNQGVTTVKVVEIAEAPEAAMAHRALAEGAGFHRSAAMVSHALRPVRRRCPWPLSAWHVTAGAQFPSIRVWTAVEEAMRDERSSTGPPTAGLRD